MASIHGTDSTILAVQIRAPCSPWRNWESVQFWLSTPKVTHSLSAHFSTGVPVRSNPAPNPPLASACSTHQLLLVDLDLPGQVGLAVPLGALGLLVELVELRPGALLVVPGEDGVVVRVHDVAAVGLLGPDHREDRSRSRRSRLRPMISSVLLISVVMCASPDGRWFGGRMCRMRCGRSSGGSVRNGVMSMVEAGSDGVEGVDPREHEGLHQMAGLGRIGQVHAGDGAMA